MQKCTLKRKVNQRIESLQSNQEQPHGLPTNQINVNLSRDLAFLGRSAFAAVYAIKPRPATAANEYTEVIESKGRGSDMAVAN